MSIVSFNQHWTSTFNQQYIVHTSKFIGSSWPNNERPKSHIVHLWAIKRLKDARFPSSYSHFPPHPFTLSVRRRVRSPVPSFHHFLRVPSGSFPPLFQDTGSVLLLPRSAVTEAETSAKAAKGVGRWELRGLERNRLPTDALSSPLTGKKSENARGCGDPPSTTVANKKAGFRQSRSLDFWHSELKNRPAAPASRWRIKKKKKKKK